MFLRVCVVVSLGRRLVSWTIVQKTKLENMTVSKFEFERACQKCLLEQIRKI